ncbi:MAG: 23S rRNA (adenine(2503)-C(2))-methyltransferase RlmN [Desulfitobacteriaceae bacterium]
MERLELRGCLEKELTDTCLELGLKRFRAAQVFQWVQDKCVRSWEEMNNIGAKDQEILAGGLDLLPLELLQEQRAGDGTRKYLFGLADRETIECVLMDYDRVHTRDRHTICVSTQVGCAVGCAFCATGLGGFRRNLSVGEIVGQVLEISRLMRSEEPESRVTNIVFMGMGEPLLNYEAVLKAVQLLNSQHGQGIGMRRMTLSTSGVAPKICQLAVDNPQVGLAVSLHAASDLVRDNLVPMNRRYPLVELMAACREYSDRTGRRVTFEVALTDETSDIREAERMAELLQGQLAHVNLIPVNPVAETKIRRPNREKLAGFAKILERAGIAVTIREERGTDIDAACGQLRRRHGEWMG